MESRQLYSTLLVRALIANLESYQDDLIPINPSTLLEFEKLMTGAQTFLSKCTVFESSQEDKDELNMFLDNGYHPAEIIRCRVCNVSFANHHTFKDHLQRKHGIFFNAGPKISCIPSPKVPLMPAPPPEQVSFLERNCIPKTAENLSKSTKKFLRKDPNSIASVHMAMSDLIRNDSNSLNQLLQLRNSLFAHFPRVVCYQFGSRSIGTASVTSDIDVFIDLEGTFYGREGKQDVISPQQAVEVVKSILEQTSLWSIEAVSPKARVPLLKVTHLDTGTKCDLSFTDGLGCCNTKFVEYLFSLQPTSRALVCYLKQWNIDSCLTSYTIVLMVVFFYQCRGLLPSMEFLQRYPDCTKNIDCWNAGFATPPLSELEMEECKEPVSVLSRRFFYFYSTEAEGFSWETDIVCPYLGRLGITKKMFADPNLTNMPREMVRYQHYIAKQRLETDRMKLFAYDRPFVVQDPIDLSHNVAKGVPPVKAAKFLRNFYLSAIFPSTV
ncbi:terminal uridylyltransferase Tailor-like isoform X1 [Anopheles albimanus]|uniref:terminal uridylyltransferase Tailor-like isoform X1 n=1 Tax=Anopheles albimanus TaxID=7167 RepID=UPI00164009B5|nr:terminal uridylyltransferase Tailor-like isoform X1 [Anopheles albimanus]